MPFTLSPCHLVTLSLLLLTARAMPAEKFPEVSALPANPKLPDPLVTLSGEKVTTKEQWRKQRRPELKALFEHYMYGKAPPAPKNVKGAVAHLDKKALGGKATLKDITLSFGPPETPKVHLLLVVPNEREGPAPCFVGLNFAGNHTAVNDPKVRLPVSWMRPRYAGVKDNRATDAGRGKQVDVWAIEQSIDRGYAVALAYCGDIDPDKNDFSDGVHAHYYKEGQTRPGPHEWCTIAAWAWGIQRMVDYLVTDKDIDARRIAVVGHSRLGKTALLAAAFDDRIALAIPHQAGCGGTAPSRNNNPKAESVKRINTSFPHWFNDTFKEFNDHPEKLPFDQHCLAALCAPRPVLFTNAVEDQWANPSGQFKVLEAAEPVYRLLGAGGLDAKKMPAPGKLIDSTLGYYIRPGKHSMTRGDWKVFLDYADKHLGGKQ